MAQRLAVFDLDGTIARRDTFVPFVLGYLLRNPWRLPRLALAVPPLAGFPFGLVGRGRLKAAIIRAALGGLPRTAIDAWAHLHAQRVVDRGLFADALAAIEAHRANGDLLVLMSASPDLYVPHIARLLDFDAVVCTEVRWHDDRLTGDLATPNRRGAEKTRCLATLQAAHPGMASIAYGNSGSDIEHLLRCDEGVYVNGGDAVRRDPSAQGLRHVRWS